MNQDITMKKHIRRTWLARLGLLLTVALTACQSPGKEATFGGDLTGIDHLANYLSVSDFSVNGAWGAQAGNGGSTTCCVVLPEKWHPGLTVHVKWNVSNWKDHAGSGSYEADVPVDRYTKPEHVWVHFLSDGTVRVVVSDYYPRSPDYPGPHDPIPQKHPWDDYQPSWVKKRPNLGEPSGTNAE
jgi:hypothetical protein